MPRNIQMRRNRISSGLRLDDAAPISTSTPASVTSIRGSKKNGRKRPIMNDATNFRHIAASGNSSRHPLKKRRRSSSTTTNSRERVSINSNNTNLLAMPVDLIHVIALYLTLPELFLSFALISKFHYNVLFGKDSHYLWRRFSTERFRMLGLKESLKSNCPLSKQVMHRLKTWIHTMGPLACCESNQNRIWMHESRVRPWKMKSRYLISDMITCDFWRPSLRILLVDFWSIVLFDLESGEETVLFSKRSSRLFHKPQKLICVARGYENHRLRRSLLCLMSRREQNGTEKQVIIGMPIEENRSTGAQFAEASTKKKRLPPQGTDRKRSAAEIEARAAAIAMLERTRSRKAALGRQSPLGGTPPHRRFGSSPVSTKRNSSDTFIISCPNMSAYLVLDENSVLVASHSQLLLFDALTGSALAEYRFGESRIGSLPEGECLRIVNEDSLIGLVTRSKCILLQYTTIFNSRSTTGATLHQFKVLTSFSNLHLNTACPIYIYNRRLYASQMCKDFVSLLRIDFKKRSSVSALKKNRRQFTMLDIKITPISSGNVLILWGRDGSEENSTEGKLIVDCLSENDLLWSQELTLPWKQRSPIAATLSKNTKLNNLQIVSNVVSLCVRSALHQASAHTYLLSLKTGEQLEMRSSDGTKRYPQLGMPHWWTVHDSKLIEFS